MQRVQAHFLLMLALSLVGCDNRPTAPGDALSVAGYLHDLDEARAVLVRVHKDPARLANTPDAVNASAALAKAVSPSFLECWPVKPASTKTTNHECLDAKGYKR